jgi:hypothetical protein
MLVVEEVALFLSLTANLTLAALYNAEGVPVTAPVEGSKLRPDGKVPKLIKYVSGAEPPEPTNGVKVAIALPTVNVWLVVFATAVGIAATVKLTVAVVLAEILLESFTAMTTSAVL